MSRKLSKEEFVEAMLRQEAFKKNEKRRQLIQQNKNKYNDISSLKYELKRKAAKRNGLKKV